MIYKHQASGSDCHISWTLNFDVLADPCDTSIGTFPAFTDRCPGGIGRVVRWKLCYFFGCHPDKFLAIVTEVEEPLIAAVHLDFFLLARKALRFAELGGVSGPERKVFLFQSGSGLGGPAGLTGVGP